MAGEGEFELTLDAMGGIDGDLVATPKLGGAVGGKTRSRFARAATHKVEKTDKGVRMPIGVGELLRAGRSGVSLGGLEGKGKVWVGRW